MNLSKTNKNNLVWIYWGTLISSLGTFAFPGATIGMMTQMKFPLWQIGLLMGFTRLGSLVGSFFFGDLSEKYNTKKIVLYSEIFAFVLSLLLVLSWRNGQESFPYFAFLVFLRFLTISIGAPGRNKLVKILSDEYRKSHFQTGILLNVVTYGPGVVGSLLGFAAVKYFFYESVLIFDAFTFILNGIILFRLEQSPSTLDKKSNSTLIDKITRYFSHKELTLLDILIVVPFMGTNVLMSRLSQGDGSRVPILLMSFGLAVFISYPILKKFRDKTAHIISYLVLIISFIVIGIFQDNFSLVFIGVFLRNISYWYIFNLYTGLFQEREPSRSIASLFAARAFFGTAILGIGEFFFGIYGQTIDIQWDLGLRACVAFSTLIFIHLSKEI